MRVKKVILNVILVYFGIIAVSQATSERRFHQREFSCLDQIKRLKNRNDHDFDRQWNRAKENVSEQAQCKNGMKNTLN